LLFVYLQVISISAYIHEEKKANKQKVVNLATLEYWPYGKLLVEKDTSMHIINYW